MSREAFEHWFVRHYISRGYVSSKAELQEAWQAATSAQEARVKELEEALHKTEASLSSLIRRIEVINGFARDCMVTVCDASEALSATAREDV